MSKITIIGEGSVSDVIRSFKAGEILKERGYDIEIQNVTTAEGKVLVKNETEVAIFSRPLSPEAIRYYKRIGAVVIADQDDDFAAIPPSHVGYKSIGRGNAKILASHLDSLREVDTLIVSTPELALRFAQYNSNILVIPNGWDSANPKTGLPKRSWFPEKDDAIVIGWGGTITHREDFKLVIEPLKAVCRDYPNVKVFIAGDPENYNALRWLEEERKMFFPFMPYEDYVLFLKTLDILLVPLVDDHFNRAKSDIKLVDAGSVGLPWIASALPQYTSWGGGGLAVHEGQSWEAAMKVLIHSPEGRKDLGEVGRTLARQRTFDTLSYQWEGVIKSALSFREERRAHTLHLLGQQDGMELLGMAGDDTTTGNPETGDTRGEDSLH